MQYLVDPTQIVGFAQALRDAPDVLLRHLAKGYQQIGRYDTDKLRQSLPGRLNVQSKGLANSFKYKATDPARATSFDKLFDDEYTGWKAARIFETGGTITGKGKQLTILFEEARNAGGRRKYTQQRLRQLIASGKVSFVPTPRGMLIIEHKGGLTKSGKGRKGSRDVILGLLKKSVTEQKRLDFYDNILANQGMHQDILETAIENAALEIRQRAAEGK